MQILAFFAGIIGEINIVFFWRKLAKLFLLGHAPLKKDLRREKGEPDSPHKKVLEEEEEICFFFAKAPPRQSKQSIRTSRTYTPFPLRIPCRNE